MSDEGHSRGGGAEVSPGLIYGAAPGLRAWPATAYGVLLCGLILRSRPRSCGSARCLRFGVRS